MDSGDGFKIIEVLFFKDELARVHRISLPSVESGSFRFREDDFHDFKVHEVEDGPDVPTFGYLLASIALDFIVMA